MSRPALTSGVASSELGDALLKLSAYCRRRLTSVNPHRTVARNAAAVSRTDPVSTVGFCCHVKTVSSYRCNRTH
jgi:hypothetical protein